MQKPDFYKLLGVSPAASNLEIRKAYRALVLQYHPDRKPDDKEAENFFKAFSEAYQVLSNEVLRTKYDLTIAHKSIPRAAYQPPSSPPPNQPAAKAQTKESETFVDIPYEKATPNSETRPKEPTAPRTRDRVLRPLLDYQNELNELDAWDGVLGIVFGISATLMTHAYIKTPERRPEFVVLFLWACVPFVLGPTGFYIGRKIEQIVDDHWGLQNSDRWWTTSFIRTLPLLFPLALCCGVLITSQFFQIGVFTWRILPAAVAAGLAAIVGSGVGRAFVLASQSSTGRLFGGTVAAIIGAIGGLVMGFVLALLSIGRGYDILFFEGFFSAGCGGAIGGAIASFIGAFKTISIGEEQ